MSADTAVVILAGGNSTRLPGKLVCPVGDEPLVLRVYRSLKDGWPVYIAGNADLSESVGALLDCPMLFDRWPRRGPLAALVSVAGVLQHRYMIAVAGDLPFITRAAIEALVLAWMDGDEAVVAVRDGRDEPLVALYDRTALLREGFALIRDGNGAMHALLERLRVRRVPVEADVLLNVNTPADLELALVAQLKGSQ